MKFRLFLFLTAFSFLLFSSCFSINKVSGIEYIVSSPISLNKNGQINLIVDTVPIYYFKNDLMYYLPAHYSFMMNGHLTQEGVTHSYFVFRKKDKFGLQFMSIDDAKNGKRMPVDSIKKIHITAEHFFHIDDSLLLVNKTVDNEGNICKAYINKSDVDRVGIDTTFYYYSTNFKNMPLSLSYKQDRTKKLKLYKVKRLTSQIFDKKRNILFPKSEYFFEIHKMDVANPEKLLLFFKAFDSTRKSQLVHATR